MTPEVFQAALERGDIDAAGEMLADNVVFRSPAVFEPYEGKPATLVLLKAVSSVFQDFRYVRTFVEEDAGAGAGLRGQGRHPHVEGVDLLRLDAQGLVDDFRVMVRPHSALEALMDGDGADDRAGAGRPGPSDGRLTATRPSRRRRASARARPRWCRERRPRTGR